MKDEEDDDDNDDMRKGQTEEICAVQLKYGRLSEVCLYMYEYNKELISWYRIFPEEFKKFPSFLLPRY